MSFTLPNCVDYLLLIAPGERQSLHWFGLLGTGVSITLSVMLLMEAMGACSSPPAQTETMVCVIRLWLYDCGDCRTTV